VTVAQEQRTVDAVVQVLDEVAVLLVGSSIPREQDIDIERVEDGLDVFPLVLVVLLAAPPMTTIGMPRSLSCRSVS